MTDADAESYLGSLIFWAEKKGYLVVFGPKYETNIRRLDKLIEINNKISLEKQVYCLLHECGHVLIFENGSSWNYLENKYENPRHPQYNVYTVIEEADAWSRAYKLAKRLKIYLREEDWREEVIDAMHKYIIWAGKN